MGRPTDNPKQHKITIRLDDETNEILDKYSNDNNIGRAEAARRAIRKLKDEK